MSAVDLPVLHSLRVKGATGPAELAELTGLDVAQVEGCLAAAVADGFASLREGRAPKYRLTPEGKARAADLLVADTDEGARAEAERLYDAFVPLNSELKELTSAWQLRDGAPNDHSDAGYDAAVVARLAAVCDGICAALPAPDGRLGRMARYRDRFAGALARVRAGEHAAFARPMAGSFHDAWMELHQDLLLTLGRERSAADGH